MKCTCAECNQPAPGEIGFPRMYLCPQCGNKRCPGAVNHDRVKEQCKWSNFSGQPNSFFADVPCTVPPEQQALEIKLHKEAIELRRLDERLREEETTPEDMARFYQLKREAFERDMEYVRRAIEIPHILARWKQADPGRYCLVEGCPNERASLGGGVCKDH